MKVLCTNGVKAVTARACSRRSSARRGQRGRRRLWIDQRADGQDRRRRDRRPRGALRRGDRRPDRQGRDRRRAAASISPSPSIGVAVRRGAAAPDIGTVEALKATLLAAKSVMYSKTGISGVYMPKLLEKLGIAEQIAPKAVNPVLRHRRRGAGARRSRDRRCSRSASCCRCRASRWSARCRTRCNW